MNLQEELGLNVEQQNSNQVEEADVSNPPPPDLVAIEIANEPLVSMGVAPSESSAEQVQVELQEVFESLDSVSAPNMENNMNDSIEIVLEREEIHGQAAPLETLDTSSESPDIDPNMSQFLEEHDLDALEKSTQELEVIRSTFAREILEIEKLRENLEVEIELHVSVREDLNQWISARKESFAWKLTDKLRSFERDLSKDEVDLKEFSKNEPGLDFEFGAKTRRWVMKSIAIPFLVISGIIALIEIIRGNSGSTNLPDPNNPAISIPTNNLDIWLDENLGLTHQQIDIWLVVLMVMIFIGVLFAFSRKTSEYRQVVAEEVQLTKVMEESVHNVKNERERLDSLHPQVPQILELLSLGLHKPWEIDSKYLSFEGEMPDASKIPESLDISVPTQRSSSRVFPQLVHGALNEIQKPGWRQQAFERAIQRLSESAGFGGPNTALKELDMDHRRSGKRQILVGLQGKSEILTQVGDELVREFASTVQEKVLPFAQPDVISLRPDALAHLLLTDNLVGGVEEDVSPWESRLSEIAQAGSPWSPSTFSARGQMAARHEKKPESVFIASDRATQHAHKEVSSFKEVVSGTRPFEVSIRVDLSEWCHPEELAIFQDYQPSEAELDERAKHENLAKQTIEIATEGHENVAF